MSLRFLILNTDYSEFLRWIYAQHPGLEEQPYEEQMRVRNESMFGVADFYSSNLCKLGHEAWDIHANNESLQKAWSKEHGIPTKEPGSGHKRWQGALRRTRHIAAQTSLRRLKPLFRPMLCYLEEKQEEQTWFYDILSAQIKHYKPDILLNHDIGAISGRFLQEMKSYVRLLVGQIASPLPEKEEFRCYDLVISSLPNFVEHFNRMGLPTELHRFAFEPGILTKLNGQDAKIPVSFVGSVSGHHETRVRLLEQLCVRPEVKVWGQGVESVPQNSPIHRCYMGQAWGIEMYQILRNSEITLNHHIDIADSYANNMRLFEATGVGTLLITDWKVNLHEMFEPGKEVVTYCTADECAELIHYYLQRDEERETIARAGQERTLREHNYFQRMQELVGIVDKYI